MHARFVAIVVCICMLPLFAHAALFGGPILPFPCPFGTPGACKCYNGGATYITVGPPNPGAFVWTLASRTYLSGPPLVAGQYVLGSATVPYYCVLNLFPVVVVPGLHVDYLGTSGISVKAAADAAASTLPTTTPATTISLEEYCRTRTTPPIVVDNDPCAQVTPR